MSKTSRRMKTWIKRFYLKWWTKELFWLHDQILVQSLEYQSIQGSMYKNITLFTSSLWPILLKKELSFLIADKFPGTEFEVKTSSNERQWDLNDIWKHLMIQFHIHRLSVWCTSYDDVSTIFISWSYLKVLLRNFQYLNND